MIFQSILLIDNSKLLSFISNPSTNSLRYLINKWLTIDNVEQTCVCSCVSVLQMLLVCTISKLSILNENTNTIEKFKKRQEVTLTKCNVTLKQTET